MTHVLESLLLVPGLPLLLILLGLLLLWPKPRAGATCLGLGGALAYLMCMPLTGMLLMSGLQKLPPVTAEQIKAFEPQWIVVLGGGKDRQRPDWGGETLSAYSLDRLRYAARLARQTGLPVLTSGGSVDGEGEPEALLMRQALRDEFGIQRVVAEQESRNTRENAVESGVALRANNATKALLVTHAAHMRRAQAAFFRIGVDVLPAPTGYFNDHIEWSDYSIWLPDITAMQAVRYALHERLGYWWYDWQGWVVERRF